MSDIQFNKEFTADDREDGVVSIALELTDEPDEMWKRSFNDWIENKQWLGDKDGMILGFSFPYTYDSKNKLEIRAHTDLVEEALGTLSMIMDKVNEERAEALSHGAAPHATKSTVAKVQDFLDNN